MSRRSVAETSSRARHLGVLLCATVTFAPCTALAQQTANVVVRDDAGRVVPFAVVTLVGGVTRIADDSGRAQLDIASRDSVRLQVRRIGYREHFAWVRRGPDGAFAVTLQAVARALEEVEVTAAANTPLARTGFYDRVERVKKGAFTAEFISPEELEARNAMQISRLLEGRRAIRVGRKSGQPVILGRGGCGMTVIVDGTRITGMVEDDVVGEAPQSITPRSGPGSPNTLSIDQVVNGNEVMAIEIYPSTANAPAELIPLGGRGSCGMVVIWTGGRK